MPSYDFSCVKHGRREVSRPYQEASDPAYCPLCIGEAYDAAFRRGHPRPAQAAYAEVPPMRRIYSGQAFIMRPDGWSLRPGDKGYWNFNRQQELHQLRDGGTPADRKRLDASLFARPAPPKPTYTDKQMREIRNFSEIVDREIRASADIPELIRDDSAFILGKD